MTVMSSTHQYEDALRKIKGRGYGSKVARLGRSNQLHPSQGFSARSGGVFSF